MPPPCASRICFEIAKPRPVPWCLVVAKSSKRRSSSGMPGPSSSTVIRTFSFVGMLVDALARLGLPCPHEVLEKAIETELLEVEMLLAHADQSGEPAAAAPDVRNDHVGA